MQPLDVVLVPMLIKAVARVYTSQGFDNDNDNENNFIAM